MTTVRLDDGRLMSIVKDTKFWGDFPYLRTLAQRAQRASQAKGGCSSCRHNRNQDAENSLRKVIADTKSYMTNMSGNERAALKRLLNADEIRLTVRDSSTGRFREIRY